MYQSGSRPWNPTRGRGRGRGGSKPTNQSSSVKLPPARDWMQSLMPVPIGIFDASTLCFVKNADSPAPNVDGVPFEQQENITFEDFKYIGSYNWTDRPGQIIVPGSPRVWKNISIPFTAKNDLELNPGGTRFVDQNSHRFPDAPLLPLFEAVDEVQSSNGTVFDWVSADFISDRNGLRKLIRWAEASAKLNDFRIDVDLVGYRTILLGRWEPRTLDEATPWAFGFGFEHSTTKAATGCEEGTGHHRIVTYDFGGLQMVVRYEVDACSRSSLGAEDSPSRSGSNVDDLTDLLAGASLTDAKKFREHTQLSIIRAGTVVPQADILELTTRSVRNAPDFDWGEALPQLHLSGTPMHILGVHERGTFQEIRKTRIGSTELRSAEAKAQLGLRKLRAVLESIQDVMVGGDLSGKKVSLVCKDGKLGLYERKGVDLVPESVLQRFEQ